MTPLIYGYMRVYEGQADGDVRSAECALRRFADTEGYALAAIHQETDDGGTAALTALVTDLKRTGARAVVVPSIEHFGRSEVLQRHRCAWLEHEAGAQVHEVKP